MKTWAVDIRKAKDNVVWAFPYYLPKGTMPPYPGFQVLEEWLQLFYPNCQYQRLYNNGNSVLKIIFDQPEDCFIFVMEAAVPKNT